MKERRGLTLALVLMIKTKKMIKRFMQKIEKNERNLFFRTFLFLTSKNFTIYTIMFK